MDVNQKDLVLISYPFSNLEYSKVRPAIIVSNNFLNKKSDDCVAIPLTTIIKDEPFSIIINQQDLASGKLIKQSRVRLNQIFSRFFRVWLAYFSATEIKAGIII